MARLLSWPKDLKVVAQQPLTGPRTVGAAGTESIRAYTQTVASAFGTWRWSFTVRAVKGAMARLHRGTVAALHGGANAIRVPLYDPDIMSWAESGVDATPAEIRVGAPWSNGQSWSNGENWGVGRPWATVSQAAAKGDTVIHLADEYWGHTLDIGARIGFVPLHFGVYKITEIYPLEPGKYRVWPPLRKALTTSDVATLTPVIAMRPESEAAATAARGLSVAEGNTLTMVEVEDADVRTYFAD